MSNGWNEEGQEIQSVASMQSVTSDRELTAIQAVEAKIQDDGVKFKDLRNLKLEVGVIVVAKDLVLT